MPRNASRQRRGSSSKYNSSSSKLSRRDHPSRPQVRCMILVTLQTISGQTHHPRLDCEHALATNAVACTHRCASCDGPQNAQPECSIVLEHSLDRPRFPFPQEVRRPRRRVRDGNRCKHLSNFNSSSSNKGCVLKFDIVDHFVICVNFVLYI